MMLVIACVLLATIAVYAFWRLRRRPRPLVEVNASLNVEPSLNVQFGSQPGYRNAAPPPPEDEKVEPEPVKPYCRDCKHAWAEPLWRRKGGRPDFSELLFVYCDHEANCREEDHPVRGKRLIRRRCTEVNDNFSCKYFTPLDKK